MSDAELIALGTREVGAIGLVDPAKVIDGAVVRVPKAYPVYDGKHIEALEVLREYFAGFSNLQLAGRNGLHKYNNQDHAMITGILAAEALLGRKVDPWTVNVEDEYLEEGDMSPGHFAIPSTTSSSGGRSSTSRGARGGRPTRRGITSSPTGTT